MLLFIDTTDTNKVTIGIDDACYSTDARQEKSQKLLPFIIEIIQREGKELADISEIEVATGPGSFTGLRVGVSVANALGWALSVPVNGINVAQHGTISPTYS